MTATATGKAGAKWSAPAIGCTAASAADIRRNVGSRRYGERVLDSFHPAVRAWFERRFPAGPTEPQAGGWQEIAAGRHTLIAAPTGSGKTLAAFLVCIDRLYRGVPGGGPPGSAERGVPGHRGLGCPQGA